MKIFILTLGTRGDLELFAMLGSELQRRGHQVLIGTSPFYGQQLEADGFHCRQIGNGTETQMQQVLADLADIPLPVRRTEQFIERWIKPQLDASASTLFSYALGADYFISNLKMAIPRQGLPVPGAFITYDMPEPGTDVSAEPKLYAGRIIELVAMNRQLIDPKRLWNPTYQFTGFWLRPSKHWIPPAPLKQFIEGGQAPVVLTMGSMTRLVAGNFVEMFIAAVRRVAKRGVILAASTEGLHSFASADMFFGGEAPYDWLFPQTSCVVHHGSIGASAACLAAGRPCIIIPQISAQESLAQVLLNAGVAAGVISMSELNPLVDLHP